MLALASIIVKVASSAAVSGASTAKICEPITSGSAIEIPLSEATSTNASEPALRRYNRGPASVEADHEGREGEGGLQVARAALARMRGR